jgi:hypothetical protein
MCGAMPRTLRTITVTAAVVVGLSGCSLHPGGPTTTSGAPVLTTSDVDLVTRSGGWAAAESLLTAADDALTRSCMERHGFAYPVAGPPASGDDDESAVIDLAERRVSGYGLTRSNDRAPDPVDTYVDSLAPAEQTRFQQALFGPADEVADLEIMGGGRITAPLRGCVADARHALYGDDETWSRVTYLPMQINNQLAESVRTTPEYGAALDAWRRCMAVPGPAYPDPAAARLDLQKRLASEGATPELRRIEIATATRDGECAATTHLPLASLQARRRLALGLPDEQRTALHEAGSLRDQAVTRGRAAVVTG